MKSVVRKEFTFNHYKQCLLDQTQTVTQMKLFQSKDHYVTTKMQSKISLSCYDDKRYIRDDGESTFAHGYDGSERK